MKIYNLKKSLSIIITAFKSENYILECINSILNANLINNLNYEILVGIDGCEETLNKLLNSKIKNKIKIYYNEINQGTYPIRNFLVSESKNENILFFDSDDYLKKNFFEETILKYNNFDILRYSFIMNIKNKYFKIKEKTPGTFIIKKKIFLEYGGFKNYRCGSDREFMNKTENIVNEIFIKKNLFYRRVLETSLTQIEDYNLKSNYRKKVKLGLEKEQEIIKLKLIF